MPSTSGPYVYTYTTTPVDALVVTGVGPIRYQDEAISLTDSLGDPTTCRLTVGNDDDAARNGITATPPQVGATVEIATLGRRLMVGTILMTTQVLEGAQRTQKKWHADLVDWTWQFNRLIPFGTWPEDMSVSDLVTELVATYAPGFTTVHVESGLDDVTYEADGSKTLGEVLDDLCDLIPGARWKVDDDQDVHFGVAPEVDEVPDALTNDSTTLQFDPPLRYTRDLSQVRTRVFVRGTGCFATWDDLPAQGALAAIMGGDGVIEAPVIDRPELTTEAACLLYAQAVTAVYGRPIEGIEYPTRDPKSETGKIVSVNLTTCDPPIVGEFLIQSVSVSQIAQYGETFPLYQVTASSVRFTIEDLLRGSRPPRHITGHAESANRLSLPHAIHGTPFDGTADISLAPRIGVDAGLRIY